MFLKYSLKGQIKSCIGKTQFSIMYNQLVDSHVVCQVAENTLHKVSYYYYYYHCNWCASWVFFLGGGVWNDSPYVCFEEVPSELDLIYSKSKPVVPLKLKPI